VLEVALDEEEEYVVSSADHPVTPNKKYAVFTKVTGISGKPYCACFGVILLDGNKKANGRRIQWLNDFSGKEQEYRVIFQVPAGSKSIRMIYRINKQTPASSNCKFKILPLKEINLSEASPEAVESYDKPANYMKRKQQNIDDDKGSSELEELSPEEEDALERNLVWIFYHPCDEMDSVVESLFSRRMTKAKTLNNLLIGSHFANMRKLAHTYVRDIDYRAKRSDYFFNYKYILTLRFYIRKLILNRIYAQIHDSSNVMLINESKGSIASDLLMECFPNSKMLFFTQDGRDILRSLITPLVEENESSDRAVRGKRGRSFFITKNAESWRINMDSTIRAFDRHAPDKRVMVKYEELRKNTAETVKVVYDFLGTNSNDDNQLNNLPRAIKGSSDTKNWQKYFSQEEQETIHEIMEEMLQRLGYIGLSTTPTVPSISSNQKRQKDTKKIWAQKYDGYNINPLPLVELSPDEEDALERNLVWILSNPRSGTTWLGTQLLSYKTNTWNEPLIGAHLVDLHETPKYYVRDIDFRSTRPNYFFNAKYASTWRYFLRKLILNRIYAQFGDLERKTIIKEPNGSIAADMISLCLPNSKIIALLRDGRDTVDSRLDALTTDAWGTKFFGENSREAISSAERPKIIRSRSKLWRVNMETVLEAFENHKAENRIMIRYEELRKNTFDETKKIYQFIDVPIAEKKLKKIVDQYTFENLPDSMKGSGKFVRAASPGRWRDSFSDEEKKIMHDIMGHMLEKLGYLQ